MPPIPFRGNPMGKLLPAGYTRVEYLESTGTQYIDTGIHGTNKLGVHIEFEYPTSSTKASVFGTKIPGGNYGWKGFTYISSNRGKAAGDILFVALNGISSWECNYYEKYPSIQIAANTRYVLDSNIKGSNQVYCNGINICYGGTTVFECPKTAPLFAVNGYSDTISSITSYGAVKVYTLQISNEVGEILLNFIPALDPNNKPCMYDTVTKQPFYNKGTGEFSTPPQSN